MKRMLCIVMNTEASQAKSEKNHNWLPALPLPPSARSIGLFCLGASLVCAATPSVSCPTLVLVGLLSLEGCAELLRNSNSWSSSFCSRRDTLGWILGTLNGARGLIGALGPPVSQDFNTIVNFKPQISQPQFSQTATKSTTQNCAYITHVNALSRT